MKANELRIGNYINYFTKMVKVIGVSKSMLDGSSVVGKISGIFIADNGNVINDPDAFDGIPLTEEWLLKFGINPKKCRIVGQAQIGFSIIPNEGTSAFYIDYMQDEVTLHAPLDYLHQLQNLYFALTGQELEIK